MPVHDSDRSRPVPTRTIKLYAEYLVVMYAYMLN
ncbi:hypothetical protein C8N40_101546 [Pontibacter mucosus]|uniref:Uncharacterized protein n=1 Tax=Pontibacter mucosus TaxID=1649266 RepID=A0A2T5YTS2_9BACT|nr:hypothetical protein C8N40_101546 [Pontibacter mucosus]